MSKRTCSIGRWGLLLLIPAFGCSARVDPDGAANEAGEGSCAEGERQLAPDGCHACICEGGELACPSSTGDCQTQCRDGDVVPGPGHCGYCTCIENAWVCDSTAECECEFVSDPSGGNCDDVTCSRYGEIVGVCEAGGSGGLNLDTDGDVAGEDPFADPLLVPCEDAVPLLGDQKPGRVVTASLDADQLRLDVEYEGGCAEHRFGLCYYDQPYDRPNLAYFARTLEVWLAHDAGGDLCGQRESVSLSFEVSAASALFERRVDRFDLDPQGGFLLRIHEHTLPYALP